MTTPPDLDLTALMVIAERATPGPWTIEPPQAGFSEIYGPNGELIFGLAAGGENERLPVSDIKANAAFLDAFSPSSVLAILTRLVAAEARAEKTEAERDEAQARETTIIEGCNALTELLKADLDFAKTQRDTWISVANEHHDALAKAEARVAVLEGLLAEMGDAPDYGALDAILRRALASASGEGS